MSKLKRIKKRHISLKSKRISPSKSLILFFTFSLFVIVIMLSVVINKQKLSYQSKANIDLPPFNIPTLNIPTLPPIGNIDLKLTPVNIKLPTLPPLRQNVTNPGLPNINVPQVNVNVNISIWRQLIIFVLNILGKLGSSTPQSSGRGSSSTAPVSSTNTVSTPTSDPRYNLVNCEEIISGTVTCCEAFNPVIPLNKNCFEDYPVNQVYSSCLYSISCTQTEWCKQEDIDDEVKLLKIKCNQGVKDIDLKCTVKINGQCDQNTNNPSNGQGTTIVPTVASSGKCHVVPPAIARSFCPSVTEYDLSSSSSFSSCTDKCGVSAKARCSCPSGVCTCNLEAKAEQTVSCSNGGKLEVVSCN